MTAAFRSAPCAIAAAAPQPCSPAPRNPKGEASISARGMFLTFAFASAMDPDRWREIFPIQLISLAFYI